MPPSSRTTVDNHRQFPLVRETMKLHTSFPLGMVGTYPEAFLSIPLIDESAANHPPIETMQWPPHPYSRLPPLVSHFLALDSHQRTPQHERPIHWGLFLKKWVAQGVGRKNPNAVFSPSAPIPYVDWCPLIPIDFRRYSALRPTPLLRSSLY